MYQQKQASHAIGLFYELLTCAPSGPANPPKAQMTATPKPCTHPERVALGSALEVILINGLDQILPVHATTKLTSHIVSTDHLDRRLRQKLETPDNNLGYELKPQFRTPIFDFCRSHLDNDLH